MEIITLDSSTQLSHHTVATLGNFDGVHLGHHILLEKVVLWAKQHHTFSAVITFEPHTRDIVTDQEVQRLSTQEEKALLFEQFGIDYMVVIPFSVDYASLTRSEFCRDVLQKQLNVQELIVGKGHHFGKKEPKSEKSLSSKSAKNDISTIEIQLYGENEITASSTKIREALAKGALESAVNMLGHPYLVLAQRVRGKQIGTAMGYPTINFRSPPSQKTVPPSGVYVAEITYREHSLKGALYFGDCPTFGDREIHFEFFSLDLVEEDPEVDEMCQIWIHQFIRKDQKFESQAELIKQITDDVTIIKSFFIKD